MDTNFGKVHAGGKGGSAGFWKRALSFIIDLMVINLIVIYPFRGAFLKYFGNITLAESLDASRLAIPMIVYWMIFILSVLALLYFTFFEYYLGQTPGQMLLRLKVISLKDDDDIGLWRAALRNCFVLPFFPFYIFWVVEPLYLAFYKDRFLERITLSRTVAYDEGGIAQVRKYKDRYGDRDAHNDYDKEYELKKV